MKKFTITVWVSLAAAGASVALVLVPMDAAAQHRGTGVRGASSGVRSHAPGVRPHVPGVRSHVGHRRPRVGVVIGAPFYASPWGYHPYPYYPAYAPNGYPFHARADDFP